MAFLLLNTENKTSEQITQTGEAILHLPSPFLVKMIKIKAVPSGQERLFSICYLESSH
jgi:hypothetical protein